MRTFTAVIEYRKQGASGSWSWSGCACNLLAAHEAALAGFGKAITGGSLASIRVSAQ